MREQLNQQDTKPRPKPSASPRPSWTKRCPATAASLRRSSRERRSAPAGSPPCRDARSLFGVCGVMHRYGVRRSARDDQQAQHPDKTHRVCSERPSGALCGNRNQGRNLKSGLADVLPIGRWALANPGFVERYRRGRAAQPILRPSTAAARRDIYRLSPAGPHEDTCLGLRSRIGSCRALSTTPHYSFCKTSVLTA
jgi:hypothetical protein